MKRGPTGVTVTLAVAATIAFATAAAPADRFHGEAVGGPAVAAPPVVPRPIVSHGRAGDTIVPHGFFTPPPPSPGVFPRAFFSHQPVPVVVGAAPVLYVLPPGSAGSPAYDNAEGSYDAPAAPPVAYDPPVFYNPPVAATVSSTPSAPPVPGVVQYPTGRYELRGDGVTAPYIWVWIPNPPPPPPPAAPPATAQPSRDPSPARQSHLYRWTDEQGTLHLTDRLDAVPRQFRTQTQQDQPS